MANPPGIWHLKQAVRALAAGKIIAYPTEAVFGLGCDPLDGEAVQRINQLKRRHKNKGFILIGADFDQLQPFLAPLNDAAIAQMLASWPGPVTWVAPVRRGVPDWLTGGRKTLAVRVPGHGLARDLCRQAGPVVSTSANLARRTPALTVLGVRQRFGPRVDFVLPGPTGGGLQVSTIRHVGSGKLLRPG